MAQRHRDGNPCDDLLPFISARRRYRIFKANQAPKWPQDYRARDIYESGTCKHSVEWGKRGAEEACKMQDGRKFAKLCDRFFFIDRGCLYSALVKR